MTDNNEIHQPTDRPVWHEAAEKWFRENILPFQLDDYGHPEGYIAFAKKYAAGVDWNICRYCAGPCGYCPQKYSTDPYRCEPCPQDPYDITECTYCPIAYINYLLKLLTEESKQSNGR